MMENKYKILFTVIVTLFLCVHNTQAATPSPRKDVLGTSAVGQETNHDVTFTVATTIPASGTITLTPEPGQFSIHSSLSYLDIDVLIDGAQQPLSSTPGTGAGSALGATATTGSSGQITITLNDSDSINNGKVVEIKIGNNANFAAAGQYGITNPSSVGSYFITLQTATSSSVVLDNAKIGLAVNQPVGVSATWTGNIAAAPQFNPSAGTYSGSVSLSMTSDTIGASMYYTVDGSTPTTSSTLYTSAISINQTTTLKAIAAASGMGDSDITSAVYTITTSQPNGGGGGGGAVVPPYYPPEGQVQISGVFGGTINRSCQNGATISVTIPSGAWIGIGLVNISCLSFSTFTIKDGIKPSQNAIADTIFAINITDTNARPITTAPVPLTAVITYTNGQMAGLSTPLEILSLGRNQARWNRLALVETTKGQTIVSAKFQAIGLLTTVGESTLLPCSTRRADLNCDGQVNIIDLSILLYHWNSTKKVRADINQDGIVNLIDFSILLYWWTGTRV